MIIIIINIIIICLSSMSVYFAFVQHWRERRQVDGLCWAATWMGFRFPFCGDLQLRPRKQRVILIQVSRTRWVEPGESVSSWGKKKKKPKQNAQRYWAVKWVCISFWPKCSSNNCVGCQGHSFCLAKEWEEWEICLKKTRLQEVSFINTQN